MQYEYPQSRYKLLCDILNLNKDKKALNSRNLNPNLSMLEKKSFLKNFSMEHIKEIPKDVPHLVEALKKAYNEIAYLRNSKKEMRLEFDIRLSLYHKKHNQSAKRDNIKEDLQAIKTNLMNIILDLSDVYLVEKSSLQCMSQDCNWNRNIRYLLQKYQHVPNMYDNYETEFKKYFLAIKPIEVNDLMMKDYKNEESILQNDDKIIKIEAYDNKQGIPKMNKKGRKAKLRNIEVNE